MASVFIFISLTAAAVIAGVATYVFSWVKNRRNDDCDEGFSDDDDSEDDFDDDEYVTDIPDPECVSAHITDKIIRMKTRPTRLKPSGVVVESGVIFTVVFTSFDSEYILDVPEEAFENMYIWQPGYLLMQNGKFLDFGKNKIE